MIFVPLVALIIAGLSLAVFAPSSWRCHTQEAFSVVALNTVVALGAVFSAPLFYLRQSMASATSFSIFSVVDEATFLAADGFDRPTASGGS